MSSTQSYTVITSPYLATFTSLPDPRFQGYYETDGSIKTRQCTNTFDSLKTLSGYAMCCPHQAGVRCRTATTCDQSSKTRIDLNGDEYACGSGDRCGPQAIYQYYPDSSKGWSATVWGCLNDLTPTAVYQNMEIELTSAITLVVNATTTTIPAESSTIDITPTATSAPPDNGSSTNTGAIAGGVVGGVAGVALILGAAFFLLRRRRKQAAPELPEIGAAVQY